MSICYDFKHYIRDLIKVIIFVNTLANYKKIMSKFTRCPFCSSLYEIREFGRGEGNGCSCSKFREQNSCRKSNCLKKREGYKNYC